MINTLFTYNFMLFNFFFGSNKSNGARFGTNKIALNSNEPSKLKCCTAKCSSQSFVNCL